MPPNRLSLLEGRSSGLISGTAALYAACLTQAAASALSSMMQALLGVDQEHLARLQSPLLGDATLELATPTADAITTMSSSVTM